MDIQKIITEAVSIQAPNSTKPIITFYSGIEGIKNIYLDTLTIPPGEAIYAFLNPETTDPKIYSWLTEYYVKERIKKGIFAHVFVTGDQNSEKLKKYKEDDVVEKRTTYVVEDFGQPFRCEINIYLDKVALIDYTPNGEVIGILIQNETIASTLKAFYLHYLWKS